ncbi:hypothetical protein [Mycobacterium sp. DL440]|uniref:hypothetical protein n=1 Tax=Mycobacterium sp. DL440 TaxID=2675523 RepID=UPI001FBA571D|nr:hypothetical protein [Mycobacterium sp. DL440]
MTFPNGPYGQGFPDQPGYQQQPGYPQHPGYLQQPGYPQHPAFAQQPSYPQQGYPQQPYGMPPASPASPSGVTGIIAGVLAGLGGLTNFVGGLFMAFGLSVLIGETSDAAGSAGGAWTALIAITILNVVAGVLLLIGTVTLLLHKMIGRWLVAAGCAVSILSTLINLTVTPSAIADYEYNRGVGADLVGVIFPIVTLVLVLLPSTAAWIRAKQNPVAPQFYPPYPG